MATKTRKGRPPKRPVQAPRGRATPRPQPLYRDRRLIGGAVVVLAIVLGLGLAKTLGSGGGAAKGLPNTSDYHSLLVAPGNPEGLLLGTHQGLYRSSDGGRNWRFESLSGQDAMNLVRPSGGVIWTAGHNVLAKSTDGGASWTDVRPDGLPGLDVHGFAIDPRDPQTLYAAIAGQGLYRSRDGGRSFTLVSSEVGGDVMALAVTPDGRMLAGDMQQGLLVSGDGGRSWRQALAAQLMGIAVNPSDPRRVIVTGAGIGLSTDGGRTWRSVLDLPKGAGPVAWAPDNPRIAYAVGFDRTLYRSADGGESWKPVRKEE